MGLWPGVPMYRIFDFSNGSLAAVFGVSVHGRHSSSWWHRLLVRPVYRVGNRFHRLLWKARYRWLRKHQYNRIDTLLPPGYHDIDRLMLHGMFALLRRYVETQMGGVERLSGLTEELRADPDPNAPDGLVEAQADNQAEAAALYVWWTKERPAMTSRRNELLHALYGGERRMTFTKDKGTGHTRVGFRPFEEDEVAMEREMRDLEEKIDAEEQEMLHRLVDIRRSLWT